MLQKATRTRILAVASAMLMWTAPASAVPLVFDVVGVNDSNLTAQVVFTYDSGTIEIDITNTSLVAAGPDPRLTAFAFNVPASVTGVSGFPSAPSGWDDSYSSNGINTPGQFGKFDLAGITGPSFSGGFPNDGIPRASTFHFTFDLTGSGLGALDESSFLSLFSFEAPPPDEDEQFFIARFQRTGEDEEGSDVATPSGAPAPIPEPMSLLLLGSGLTGLWWTRRRQS